MPACPTYASWGVEMDSPRGRIDLMKGLHDGKLELTESVVAHFDQCLGCMGCVTACPSGVRYDLLIESTRAKIEAQFPRDAGDRGIRELVFATFPYPGRLRALAIPLFLYAKTGLQALVRKSGILNVLPPRLRALENLAPPLTVAQLTAKLPPFTPAVGTRRGTVAVVAGCVQRVFFPGVNAATIRVLAAEGYDVIVPGDQGCCGALSLHSGRDVEAERFAEALVRTFGDVDSLDAVIINAAGCGSTLKQYAELLHDDARAVKFAAKVKDVNEFLGGIESVATFRPMAMRVAYHDACHLAHAQRIREEPRAILRRIPELELVEIPQGDQCCGSAGTYNLFEPEAAAEIGERKVDNVLTVVPDVLASANPGCTLQITSLLAKRGKDLLAAHPIEILDAALA
ncbi:MAG: heterodisulfide reductase-related iron-sulfur binding cluster [Vulcanimicrobiaceae bacterium]